MASSSKFRKIVNIFITLLFIVGFVGGNVLRISFGNGVAIGLYDIAVGTIIIAFLLQGLKGKKFPYLLPSIGLFFLVCLVSLLLNSTRFTLSQLMLSSLYLVRLTLYTGLYAVVLKGKDSTSTWLKRLWVSMVLMGFIGFIQYFLYPDLRNLYYLGWDPHYYRIVSTILDPNFAGILFALGVFLSLYLYSKDTQKYFLIGGIILFIALLFTYSRASYLSFFVGLSIWFFSQKHTVLLGVILVAIIGFIFMLPRPGGEGVKLERMASVNARVGNMSDALLVFRSSPLSGVGFNTLRYVKNSIYTGIESHAVSGFDMSILFILSTTGLFGLAAYGNILYSLFKLIKSKNKTYSEIARLVVVSIFMIGVHGLSVNTYFYSLVLIYLAVLVGVYERKEIG